MADFESTPERDAKSPIADMELQPLTRATVDEKKSSPAVATAASSTGDDDEDEEAARSAAAARAVFERPLVYYKRNAPYLRTRRRSRGPTEIVWPDKTISLGVPPERGVDQDNDVNRNEDNLVVFSSPGEEAVMRRRYFGRCLVFGVITVFIMITVVFATASDRSAVPTLTYISSIITLALGVVSWKWENTRLLTLFIVVTYIDAILSLLRVYGWIPFIVFVVQMFVCYFANKVKQTLQPTWFTPSS